MSALSLEELIQSKADVDRSVVLAESNYLIQKRRMKDARDQWMIFLGSHQTLESQIRNLSQARVDSKPSEGDNQSGAKTETKEPEDGDS